MLALLLCFVPVVSAQTTTVKKILVAWEPVTLDADGNPCTDLGGYRLYIEALQTPPQGKPSTSALTQSVGPTKHDNVDITAEVFASAGTTSPYKPVKVWVTAFDSVGNESDYSDPVIIDISPTMDTTPPKPVTDIRVVKIQ